ATKAFGGSMVLGFNTSSTAAAPAIQMVAKPAGGAQSGFVSVKTSSSSELCGGVCRWGDYAGATPDPAADTTAAGGRVWLTNEWTVGSQRTWNWAAGVNTPGISSVTPATGPVGTLVTLKGTAFTGATSVKFGSIEASFTVVSDSSVTATVPPLAPPLATISVTTPLGTFASPTAFKVTPAITGLSALSGEVGDT